MDDAHSTGQESRETGSILGFRLKPNMNYDQALFLSFYFSFSSFLFSPFPLVINNFTEIIDMSYSDGHQMLPILMPKNRILLSASLRVYLQVPRATLSSLS